MERLVRVEQQCTRPLNRDRKFYHAIGADEVTLLPIEAHA